MLYSRESYPSHERDRLEPTRQLGSLWNAAIQLARKQIFGAKEADSIGMTCGYPLLYSRLSSLMHRGRLAALLGLLAGLALAPCARAQSAGTWNKRGQAAELRQDYDTAYEDYLKAHQKSPKDMRYEARVDRMRFQAAAAHVDRGRVLRQNGDITGALNQFTRALQIDPSNEAATQEIQITQRMDKTPGAAVIPPPGTAESPAALRDIADISAPIQLKPVSEDPITLDMVETAKNVYTAVGKLAGLNVIFDPDFDTGAGATKRIPVHLTDVSLADALRIVGMISGTFYKPVTKDTIFVGQRRQRDPDGDPQHSAARRQDFSDSEPERAGGAGDPGPADAGAEAG
jgi:general secretion pathway protein D